MEQPTNKSAQLQKTQNEFFTAAANGDIYFFKRQANPKDFIGLKDKVDNTLLLEAARHGQMEIMQWLLNKGANLNEKNAMNETAIMLAARQGHQKILQHFVKDEAVVNSIDFGKLSEKVQKDIVSVIIANKILFKTLRLHNCKALTGENLKILLEHSPGLEELDLTGCRSLKNNDLAHLQNKKIVLSLNILILNQTNFSEISVKFINLTRLEASHCPQLKKVLLVSPRLTKIALQNTPELSNIRSNNVFNKVVTKFLNRQNIQILSGENYVIDFSHNENLHDEKLQKILSQCQGFNEVILDNCPNITEEQKKHLQKYTENSLPSIKKATKFHVTRAQSLLMPKQTELNWLKQNMNDATLEKNLKNADCLVCTTLDLSFNVIGDEGMKALASFFRKNNTLQSLNLSHNKITNNGIKILMQALKNNHTLKVLDVSNNELDRSCLLFVHRMLKENYTLTVIKLGNFIKKKETLLDTKCVIVGDGATGKTSLLMSYTENRFPVEYVPTVFDNFTTGVEFQSILVNLQLWDTAGQEDYDRLRTLSYPESDVFIICFSVCGGPQQFFHVKEKWAPEIGHHSPKTPIVLAGLKADLFTDKKTLENLEKANSKPISFQEGEKMAKEIGAYAYVECSALTGKNVQLVFEKAFEACIGSPNDLMGLIQARLTENKKKILRPQPIIKNPSLVNVQDNSVSTPKAVTDSPAPVSATNLQNTQNTTLTVSPLVSAPLSTATNLQSVPFDSLNCNNFNHKLGNGKFGDVYKATLQMNGNDERLVAVKRMKINSAWPELLKEAKNMEDLAKQKKCKYIVEYIGVAYMPQGGPLLVLEFCAGGDLLSRLRDKNKPAVNLLQQLQWIYEIAVGLRFLHDNHVIHADLAARNILLTKEGHAKITDFGLTIVLTDYLNYTQGKTQKDSNDDTPWAWAAPEILKDLIDAKASMTVKRKSDIYSFGVVIWEIMALGEQPLKKLAAEMMMDIHGTLKKISEQPRTNWETIPLTTPAAMTIIINNCWKLNSAERPQAKELAQSLKAIFLAEKIRPALQEMQENKYVFRCEIENQKITIELLSTISLNRYTRRGILEELKDSLCGISKKVTFLSMDKEKNTIILEAKNIEKAEQLKQILALLNLMLQHTGNQTNSNDIKRPTVRAERAQSFSGSAAPPRPLPTMSRVSSRNSVLPLRRSITPPVRGSVPNSPQNIRAMPSHHLPPHVGASPQTIFAGRMPRANQIPPVDISPRNTSTYVAFSQEK